MDTVTLSRVNLNATLRALEHLTDLDPEAAGIIAGADEVIQFTSPAATVRLAVKDGRITHHRGAGPNTMNLGFPTAGAVNRMFAGKGIPIPLKGIRRLGFLTGPFTKLTERLEYFLRHTPELLEDEEYRTINTLLTLHLAIYATAEIGNSDPMGKVTASRIPDCDLQLAVKEGPALVVRTRDHRMSVVAGESPGAQARMVFTSAEVAGQVLRGEMPSFTAIGNDDIELSGLIHVLDNFNKLLARVPLYLA